MQRSQELAPDDRLGRATGSLQRLVGRHAGEAGEQRITLLDARQDRLDQLHRREPALTDLPGGLAGAQGVQLAHRSATSPAIARSLGRPGGSAGTKSPVSA